MGSEPTVKVGLSLKRGVGVELVQKPLNPEVFDVNDGFFNQLSRIRATHTFVNLAMKARSCLWKESKRSRGIPDAVVNGLP